MNPFFFQNNPMLNFIRTVQSVRQNPNQLAGLLKQRGLINDSQAHDIEKMNGNYEQIGQYLMQNGMMPRNVNQYKGQVDDIQRML